MKPVSNIILSLLLVAMCGLCAWQWERESRLRAAYSTQRDQLTITTAQREELASRAKSADAEVLRITASIAELRTNSISKESHDEVLQANTQMRESIVKQNAAITQHNELLAQQNAAIQQANERLKKVATERDDLAKRLNDLTARYNELAKKQ